MKILKVFSFLFFIGMASTAFGQTALDIVKKADEKQRSADNSSSVMTMKIIRPNWTREMEMKTWSKGDDYSLSLVTAPAKEKGSTTLKRKKELWSWIPRIERTVKISSSQLSQSWMGSDFTNDDLLRESSFVFDYTHKLMGEETIDGKACYKIEATPKEEAAVVWGKLIIWASKDLHNIRKTEYYDEDDYLINTMLTFDVKQFGDREVPARMEMIPADKPGYKTVMITKQADYKTVLSDSKFSIQNMKRAR